MTHNKNVNLLLCGKTGLGISATGNSILRQKCFGRQGLVLESSEFRGRQIQVVDGLSVDTKLDAQDVQELHRMAKEAMEEYGPFHAIIIVLKYGTRFTQTDKDFLRILKQTLGKDVVSKHGVMVMTNGDVFEADQEEAETQGNGRLTFKQWCSLQTGIFKEIKDECNNNVVLFNNREKSEEKQVQQIEALLSYVDSMSGTMYTSSDFAKADQSRTLQLLEVQEPGIRESVKQKVAEFKTQMEEIQNKELQGQIEAFSTLLSGVEQFSKDLKSKYSKLQDQELRNQGEKVMRGCILPVSMLESEVQGNLELARATWSSHQSQINAPPDDAADLSSQSGQHRLFRHFSDQCAQHSDFPDGFNIELD